MDSPFLGMDPYLQRYWREVHQGLITYARDQLQPKLPPELRAGMQERVFVEAEWEPRRPIYPDVYAVERPQVRDPQPAGAYSSAVAEPVIVEIPHEELVERYLEIIDGGSGGRVVTVIEFLSLANKQPGDGRALYLRKQREVCAAGTSLVEIDLVRGGEWTLACAEHRIPRSHRTTYQICVRRGWRRLRPEVYAVPLREPLPTIRIPLRETDEDVTLALQPLIEQCYRNGRYEGLDYTASPEPPLDEEDAKWADELLRSKGLRQ